MVPVFGRRELPLDEQILHLGGQFEWVAVGNNDVGDFALLERADLAPKAKNLSRMNGHGAQRLVVGQPVRDGIRGVLSEAARKRVIKAGNGKLYAGGSKLCRLGEFAIIGIVLVRWGGKHGSKNDRDVLGTEEILHFVGFRASREDHFQLLFVAKLDGAADLASDTG